jgi:hypothetical protein
MPKGGSVPSFRIRVVRGDFEVELESTDIDFVERKLAELLPRGASHGLEALEDSRGESSKPVTPRKAPRQPESSAGASSEDLRAIVDAIQNHERWNVIWSTILKGHSQLDRVLLAFYFAVAVGGPDRSLSTTDVHWITKQVHSEIAAANVTKTIRQSGRGYLIRAAGSGGRGTKYRINRSGREHVESLLAAEMANARASSGPRAKSAT